MISLIPTIKIEQVGNTSFAPGRTMLPLSCMRVSPCTKKHNFEFVQNSSRLHLHMLSVPTHVQWFLHHPTHSCRLVLSSCRNKLRARLSSQARVAVRSRCNLQTYRPWGCFDRFKDENDPRQRGICHAVGRMCIDLWKVQRHPPDFTDFVLYCRTESTNSSWVNKLHTGGGEWQATTAAVLLHP